VTSTHAKIDKKPEEDVTLLAIKGSHRKGHEIWSMGGYCGPGSGVFNPPAVTVHKMAQLTWHILSAKLSPGQQLLNTVNKCQSCLVPLPHFIDNIMTFSYHFSNCKKKESSIFFVGNQNWNCFVSSVVGVGRVCMSFRSWIPSNILEF